MKPIKKIMLVLTVILSLGTQVSTSAFGADNGMELDKGLDELAKQLTAHISTRERLTIGVADFWDLRQRTTGLGRHVGEEMATRLYKSRKKVRVIESRMLNEIVMELCINQTDMFDRRSARQFGRFYGADALLVGTITNLDTTVRINARLISTETRDSIAAAGVSIIRDDRVERLLAVMLEPEPLLSRQCQATLNIAKNEISEDAPVNVEPVFENDILRVTVKSLKRSRGRLILDVWYENLAERDFTLISSDWGNAYATDNRGTYLLSDSGERWLYKEDSQIGNHYGGTELIPYQRLMNRMVFTPENDGDGAEFTYVGHYRARWRNTRAAYKQEDIKVIIRNIVPGMDGVAR